jgi:hypothetical protein
MSAGIDEELREFTTKLLERRGGLVDWPGADQDGVAVLPPEVAETLHTDHETLRLSPRPGGEGLCVNLGADFLEVAGRLLQSEPHVGVFEVPELYLKRGALDEAVAHAFTWLNAKVRVRETRAERVEYHTWWFQAALASEDRWETCFSLSINSSSGAEVALPDPLGLWELKPGTVERADRHADRSTDNRAVALAESRLPLLAGDFLARMDSRLERDRKRLREYYGALAREAKSKKARGAAQPDPEKIAAQQRAVQLELRRKLIELEDRYAIEATLRPVVLVRTEVPALAVDLLVCRKQWQKRHTAYWNALLKKFEPMPCSYCGSGAFTLAFANESVEPLCAACAK